MNPAPNTWQEPYRRVEHGDTGIPRLSLSRNERWSPKDTSASPTVPGPRPASAFGASFALPHVPAKVPSLNAERPLSPGGANWSSCPTPDPRSTRNKGRHGVASRHSFRPPLVSQGRWNPAGLRLCFQDHVERRLGGAPDIAEAAGHDDLAQFGLTGLCAKGGTDLL
jgi:hypothetical protein